MARRSMRLPIARCCDSPRTWRRTPIETSRLVCSMRSSCRNCLPAKVLRSHSSRSNDMFGKLTWDAIPWDQPLPLLSTGFVAVLLAAVLLWALVKGHGPYLWREWITSVDHKRIGVMYCILALVMLLRGFADAIMMRAQQA